MHCKYWLFKYALIIIAILYCRFAFSQGAYIPYPFTETDPFTKKTIHFDNRQQHQEWLKNNALAMSEVEKGKAIERGEKAKAEAIDRQTEALKEQAKADLERANAEALKAKAEIEKAKAETEKARAQAEIARAEAEKTKAELAKAEAEKARIENEKAKTEMENSKSALGIDKNFDMGENVSENEKSKEVNKNPSENQSKFDAHKFTGIILAIAGIFFLIMLIKSFWQS